MRKLIGIIFFFASINANAQENNYKINIELNGFNDSVYYLVSYYADKFLIIDTSAKFTNDIQFSDNKLLPGGMYILAGEKMNKYIEFIVDTDQQFKISVSGDELIESLNCVGSEENEQFFEYLKFSKTAFEKSKQFQEKLTGSKDVSETKQLNESLSNIQKEISGYKNNFVEKYPTALLSKIFKGMQEPEIDQMLPMQEKYNIFKSQYWKTTDFTDSRMIRTPILHNKLTVYFDKIIVRHPDSLILEIDRLLGQPMAEEITNHFIWYLTLKYEYPDIMGLDKVFVHMANNYFRPKKITGLSPSIYENIEKRAKKISRVLLGENAPDLIMMDTAGKVQTLYNLKADYTIVLFWDQECQTCQKEIKLLKEFLAESTIDIKVFAVGTDSKLTDWKKYINDHNLNWTHVNGTQSFSEDYHELFDIYSTPTIYLLDGNKNIIAKRLAIAQIKDFILNYEKEGHK